MQGLAFFLFLLKTFCKSDFFLCWWFLSFYPELKIPQSITLSEDTDIVSQWPLSDVFILSFSCSNLTLSSSSSNNSFLWHLLSCIIPAFPLLTYRVVHLGHVSSLGLTCRASATGPHHHAIIPFTSCLRDTEQLLVCWTSMLLSSSVPCSQFTSF